MSSYAHDPRTVTTVAPYFALLEEKVDPVSGKMVGIERPANFGKVVDKFVKSLASARQGYT